MICEDCGKEFKPNAAVDRLMAVGHIAKLCNDCAKQPPKLTVALDPVVPTNDKDLVLRRIDWLDSQNLSLRFMALPPKRDYRVQANTLRKPKKSDMHVFVISTSGEDLVTTPPIRILSNINNFEEHRSKFWARKTPDGWDAFTGISQMEVPFQQIERVEREFGKTEIHLKNGEFLRLSFS